MKDYIQHHPWKIIEKGFNPDVVRISESLFSIGNGRMGQRANFEEKYSGESLQGSYIAGVYYPDKTRVGWWKNGYPEYFAKVLNSVSWIGIEITVNETELDLAVLKVKDFYRELDMKTGILLRRFSVELPDDNLIEVEVKRFCSMANINAGCQLYSIKTSKPCQLHLRSVLNGNVRNQDANYDEVFWENIASEWVDEYAFIHQKTRKTGFEICALQHTTVTCKNQPDLFPYRHAEDGRLYAGYSCKVAANEEVQIEKNTILLSDLYYQTSQFTDESKQQLNELVSNGFMANAASHAAVWDKKWSESDIIIEGDVAAQQAARFNIFQLSQTYTGDDARLNIGPKGFTGEKYGGSTYWDTEAYCLPFYQSTAPQQVSRNLLVYRHNHLQKAIENAEKLGFSCGAALYPMVTMNGEECHNEWEITFEEIHRNGAIAYAIYDYVKYTGDSDYIYSHGLEVLIGIARFWAQRVNFSGHQNKYVMLGVTGPNEFENNVNNNWYTNKLAAWCLTYTAAMIDDCKITAAEAWKRIKTTTFFNENETLKWLEIADNMYYPYDEERQIFLQQDGYLDKELIPVSNLPASQRPIVEHWSWDRILRSCYIKQADVLQGFYFFEDEFDLPALRRHYDFYEPLTVHESSLSPCVHSILAAKLGDEQRAYEFYLRTARLDLDDVNNDTRDGCHITSMAGTWMSITKGFAGMRVHDGALHFTPFLPNKWDKFSFKIRFRKNILQITIGKELAEIKNLSTEEITVYIKNQPVIVQANGAAAAKLI